MKNQCTFAKTEKNYEKQFWRNCFTCFISTNEGICIPCSQECHKDHRLGSINYSNFFCDCNNKLCKIRNTYSIPSSPNVDEHVMCMFNVPKKYNDNNNDNDNTRHRLDNMLNFSKSSNLVAEKLFNQLNNDCIFSPVSIATILVLLQIGSSGETKNQLTRFLGSSFDFNDLITNITNNKIVKTANLFLINQNFEINKNYLGKCKNHVTLSKQNFNNSSIVASKANNFISKKTNGMINNVINSSDISNETTVILINTIYFKANWINKFNKYNTTRSYFNNKTLVDMMNQIDDFKYYENNNLQMIEMDYDNYDANNNFYYCMGVLLPTRRFSINELNKYINNLRIRKVNVYFPKFTHRKRIDLDNILQRFCISDIFKPYVAKLDNIAKNTYVSKILHEAVVIVDEEGTEASAATTVLMTQNCVVKEEQPVIFNANHTFTYYIREITTNTILFVGNYNGE